MRDELILPTILTIALVVLSFYAMTTKEVTPQQVVEVTYNVSRVDSGWAYKNALLYANMSGINVTNMTVYLVSVTVKNKLNSTLYLESSSPVFYANTTCEAYLDDRPTLVVEEGGATLVIPRRGLAMVKGAIPPMGECTTSYSILATPDFRGGLVVTIELYDGVTVREAVYIPIP